MNTLERAITGALIGGVGGWFIESISRGHLQFSPAFDKAPIPFIPTYAAGGALLAVAAPHLKNVPWPTRAIAYAAGFSAVEYGACRIDRATGNHTWGYGPNGESCVDLEHTLAWGALGLAGEQILKAVGA
jgi:hypothetical protein